MQATITFGIKGVDRTGTVRWDSHEYGSVIWDDDFSINSTEAQQFLYDLCQDLKNSSLVYAAHLVTCPIDDFYDYLTSNDTNLTFPYEPSAASDYASFESVWNDFLASEEGKDTNAGALSYVQADGDDYVIRFYAMWVYTTVTWTESAPVSRDTGYSFDDYIEEFSENCPDGVCDSVGNVSLRWCWLVTQSAFVKSAIQGILIAMPLAFAVLLLSTRNWIISLFAVFDIIGIMLCELAIMYLMGWNFGVSECVAIVIIIGFSVGTFYNFTLTFTDFVAT